MVHYSHLCVCLWKVLVSAELRDDISHMMVNLQGYNPRYILTREFRVSIYIWKSVSVKFQLGMETSCVIN